MGAGRDSTFERQRFRFFCCRGRMCRCCCRLILSAVCCVELRSLKAGIIINFISHEFSCGCVTQLDGVRAARGNGGFNQVGWEKFTRQR